MSPSRKFLVALSLANIAFYRIWQKLLDGKLAYYSKAPVNGQMLAIFANVLLLALLFWVAALLARKLGVQRLATWGFLVVVAAVARLSNAAFKLYFQLHWAGLALFVLLLVALLFVAHRWHRQVVGALAALLLIVSPFTAVTFARGLLELRQINRVSYAPRPAAALLPPTNSPRVVWMILDEFDQRVAFDARPASVEMPEFDRLRAESLFATHAFPPSRGTELSMPALTTGRLVEKADPEGSDELHIRYRDDQHYVRWSQQPNISTRARALGFNTAVTGWYHPYCRVIGHTWTECTAEPGYMMFGALQRDSGVLRSMYEQCLDVASATLKLHYLGLLDARLGNSESRKDKVYQYTTLLEHAKKTVVDPRYGLVFVHQTVPHPMGIYDRKKDRIEVEGPSSYLDNLELTDRALGELRRVMEQTGQWEHSTVIISSDHWWRAQLWARRDSWLPEEQAAYANQVDHRIPFLVKMPGQKAGLVYEPAFNTVLTHDLVLAILRGEVKDAAGVKAWLDKNKTIGDSPYNFIKT